LEDFSLTSMKSRSTPQAAKGYGFYPQRKRSCQTSTSRLLCSRNRTSDLRVNEYELSLDRLREPPSRSWPVAGRDARRGFNSSGAGLSGIPMPPMPPHERAFRAGGLPESLGEQTVGDTCPGKALSSQCALGVLIGDTLHQKM